MLEMKHIEFLTSTDTLNLWAGKTLAERVVLFHRKFANKKISITSLLSLYLENRIKRKAVRQEKLKPDHIQETFDYRRK